MDERYTKSRKRIEKKFRFWRRVRGKDKSHVSPSGKFKLVVSKYNMGRRIIGCSRGIVTDVASGLQIADIKRNYSQFWHAWAEHPNGNEYLLCGEDYQGYSLINLSQKIVHTYFPEEGYKGFGFCWTCVYPSPDGLMLAVDGCYWGHPYDLVFYDFRNPDILPLPEIKRIGSLSDCEGWKDNDTFVLSREIEIRKSDGAPYESLTKAEQDILDNDSSLVAYKGEKIEVKRPHVEKT